MKKSFKIVLIILAALIVLGIAGFFIIKDYRAKNREPDNPNVTLYKCHMFKTLTDTDLDEIKEVVTNAVGDKVLDISKSDLPLGSTNYLTNETGESIDFGDVVHITFSTLSDDEVIDVYTALVKAYELNQKMQGNSVNDIMEIRNIVKSDYK